MSYVRYVFGFNLGVVRVVPTGLVIKASEATPRILSLAAASAPILGRFEFPGAAKRLAGIGEEKLNHQVQQEHDVHHAIKSGPKLWHLRFWQF